MIWNTEETFSLKDLAQNATNINDNEKQRCHSSMWVHAFDSINIWLTAEQNTYCFEQQVCCDQRLNIYNHA